MVPRKAKCKSLEMQASQLRRKVRDIDLDLGATYVEIATEIMRVQYREGNRAAQGGARWRPHSPGVDKALLGHREDALQSS